MDDKDGALAFLVDSLLMSWRCLADALPRLTFPRLAFPRLALRLLALGSKYFLRYVDGRIENNTQNRIFPFV